jgi:CheY-like chemotaxis protein
MGGKIEVVSHPGNGSEFTVEIPANSDKVKEGPLGEEGNVVRERAIADKRNIKILVADDNLISRELMVEQLKEAGFNSILLAFNGKEAVDMALEHSPDLILMDNRMPVMDGNTAIDRLKKKGYGGPVIILSGLAMREDIDKSMKAGAVDYITKPIDFDQFLLKIGKYLNLKNAESEEKVEPSRVNRSSKPGAEPGCESRIKDGVSDKVRNIFLMDVREKLDIITGILDKGDFENQQKTVKTIAHGYKGNAVYFGLSVLESSARELEQAFIQGTPPDVLIQQTMDMAAILKQILEENQEPVRE